MSRLPAKAGISLRPEHYSLLLDSQQSIAWLEIRPHDYFGDGGAPHHYLSRLAEKYPLAMHGHGLSLGSAESVSDDYLRALKKLIDRYPPVVVSETLCWSRWQGGYLSEPLPVPYNAETLDQVSINIKHVQNSLGRRILVENPSCYLPLEGSTMTEGAFFEELLRHTGCGLLLDLNNLYVSAMNTGQDPSKMLAGYPMAAVQEIHLSGHALQPLDEDCMLLVTNHSADIWKPVWQLYREALAALPRPVATLIEWYDEPAPFDVLLASAVKATGLIEESLPAGGARP